MKKDKFLVLFTIIMIFLLSPIIQEYTGIINVKRLKGAVVEKPKPKLTFQNYKDGTFQKSTEDYINQHFGFRPCAIRLYNQYVWDFYKQSNVQEWQVAEGKEKWLYEPWFVEEYYQSYAYTIADDSTGAAKIFETEAKRIYQLQNILKDYGTYLFVCLIPGKEMIYPEYLPENTKYFKEKKITAYDFYKKKFDEIGVNYIDMAEWFKQLKGHTDYLLFPQKGTHWSNTAAVYAADSIFKYMEALGNMKLKDLEISKPFVAKVREPDDDLEALMNLMRPLKKIPHKYVKVKVKEPKAASMPKFVTIGDSFYWNIVNQIPMKEMFSSYPYWYYNSTIYFDDKHKSVHDVDVVDELLSSDFVMLSYCTVQQYKMSNGFAKNAVFRLCYDDEEVEAKRQGMRNAICNDTAWSKAIQQKAIDKGIAFEEALDNDIQWLFDNDLEKYFPAMADSVPTKRAANINEYIRHAKNKTL